MNDLFPIKVPSYSLGMGGLQFEILPLLHQNNPPLFVKEVLMTIMFNKVEMFDRSHYFFNNKCLDGIGTILHKFSTSNPPHELV
jgi:hypothetical protein